MEYMRIMKKAYLSWGLALASLIPMALPGPAVGAISGTAVDSAGSAITRASVSRHARIRESRNRRSPISLACSSSHHLVVGEYNMTPKADGLAPISVPGVTLDLSQQRDLSFALNVAGSTQTTIVTAAEPLMNTTDG
jgi:hypothetical protein